MSISNEERIAWKALTDQLVTDDVISRRDLEPSSMSLTVSLLVRWGAACMASGAALKCAKVERLTKELEALLWARS